MNTLIWVDHEHADIIPFRLSLEPVVVLLLLDVIEAIYWANLYAGAVFCSKTIEGYNVRHGSTFPEKNTAGILHEKVANQKTGTCQRPRFSAL